MHQKYVITGTYGQSAISYHISMENLRLPHFVWKKSNKFVEKKRIKFYCVVMCFIVLNIFFGMNDKNQVFSAFMTYFL
jgi:hypothetical protein